MKRRRARKPLGPKQVRKKLDKAIEKVKKLTPEDIKNALAKGVKRVQESERKRREGPRETRTGTCVVCEGLVIGEMSREYYGDPMHMIIGPGHANQLRTVHHGWHCTKCGIKYQFPPNEIDPKTERKCRL